MPDETAAGGLKAVSEEAGGRPRAVWAVGDSEHSVDRCGFAVINRGSRPRATHVTMGMHLANAFAPLSCVVGDNEKLTPIQKEKVKCIVKDGKVAVSERLLLPNHPTGI